MTLQLLAHPFSSYCQKVSCALYENDIAFEFAMLDPDHPQNGEKLGAVWPIGKFPVLLDDDKPVIESTIIIEYLGLHYPGPVRLIPDDSTAALEVRFMDRFFDNYIQTPMQMIVGNAMRDDKDRDPYGVEQARKRMNTAYGWLDNRMANRHWAAGDDFSLADCAAAPALFYADWIEPISPSFAHVHAYRKRLLARPSFARCVDEARPYRPLFPLGAPDRD